VTIKGTDSLNKWVIRAFHPDQPVFHETLNVYQRASWMDRKMERRIGDFCRTYYMVDYEPLN
jgi:hypothetical protein